MERFFSVIDNPRDLAIFMNIYGSGLRVSEICNLRVEDVDSKSMRLFIRQSKMQKDRYTILRHCFASHALEDGVEVLYIKQLLGHTSFSSTNVYLHVSKTKVYQIDSPVDSLNL